MGTARANLDGFVDVADLFWYCMRLQPDGLESVPVVRLQKRILHIVAQRLETAFCEGAIRLRNRVPKPEDEPDCDTPFTTGSLSRNASLCREELLKRFLTKKSGFVSSTGHSENDNLVDIPGAQGRSLGSVAASQLVTAYWANASLEFLSKLSRQNFRHVAYYEDGAKVSTHEAG